MRTHDLVEDLRRALADHRLERLLRVYLAPKLLVIEEFGVWPYDRLASAALEFPIGSSGSVLHRPWHRSGQAHVSDSQGGATTPRRRGSPPWVMTKEGNGYQCRTHCIVDRLFCIHATT